MKTINTSRWLVCCFVFSCCCFSIPSIYLFSHTRPLDMLLLIQHHNCMLVVLIHVCRCVSVADVDRWECYYSVVFHLVYIKVLGKITWPFCPYSSRLIHFNLGNVMVAPVSCSKVTMGHNLWDVLYAVYWITKRDFTLVALRGTTYYRGPHKMCTPFCSISFCLCQRSW